MLLKLLTRLMLMLMLLKLVMLLLMLLVLLGMLMMLLLMRMRPNWKEASTMADSDLTPADAAVLAYLRGQVD